VTAVVVVAHPGIGEAMRSVAETILDRKLEVTVFAVDNDDDPERATQRLAGILAGWNSSDPPLVITDLPGATPHNVASAATEQAFEHAPVLTGLSLPMLLRALNHSQQPAAALAELAEHGAHRATFIGDGHEN